MTIVPASPIGRLLTAFLIIAPIVYLAADLVYAILGWDSPIAAVLHVLGAIGYSFVILDLVGRVKGRWAAVLLTVGMFGVAGNVAYGFNTIHVSLGDTDLVDASGAAVLIKPLGLLFPAALLIGALVLGIYRAIPTWTALVLGVSGVIWPIAHIGNIGWLAVAVNVLLVVVFGALMVRRRPVADGAAQLA